MTHNGEGKVSVCLLTYNHVHLIESTIASILSQSLQSFELIVSDDCSSDGTWKLIQELAHSETRIRPIQTPRNLGMAGNANYAVSISVGSYIAILHHDDLYDENLLSEWKSVLDTYPDTGFVFNDYKYPTGRVRGLVIGENPINGDWFLKNHLFKGWGCPIRGTAMIRRTYWDNIGGMRESFNLLADVDLWMRLSAIGAVGYVARALITVRQDRPDDYPETYGSSGWSWPRQKILYEIHAVNRLQYLALNTVMGRLSWWWFRMRLSAETFKWLCYGVVRHKPEIVLSSKDCATTYDLLPLQWFRELLLGIYTLRKQ